ncbi:nicotinamide riboside transporter PnuC [Paraferrimonas sp. SM1919]|uniref:nicotinamide riboside transporter PnuC n=1 Tax=Paraferrimonas sp. SM1919 TaxID=2662263 RepID=UPI001F0906C0|nr:nicotinamide riboside transporter PnuC [Paraferrimonas sp. SM1919]
MVDWLILIATDISKQSWPELAAVTAAVAYLIFAIKQSLWCWPMAAISTSIYTLIFWDVALLMESLLNVFYLAMAFYGFWQWRYGGNQKTGVSLKVWPWHKHVVAVSCLALLTVAVGYVMQTNTHASFAYLDSFTTVFAVFSTWLIAIKLVENWLYWVLINLLSAYLFSQKGLYLTTLLHSFYVVMSLYSYWLWNKEYQTQCH